MKRQTATIDGNEAAAFVAHKTNEVIEYIVFGRGINPKDVERAIELSSTKYCSVSAMLRPSVNIQYSYRIELLLPESDNEKQASIAA